MQLGRRRKPEVGQSGEECGEKGESERKQPGRSGGRRVVGNELSSSSSISPFSLIHTLSRTQEGQSGWLRGWRDGVTGGRQEDSETEEPDEALQGSASAAWQIIHDTTKCLHASTKVQKKAASMLSPLFD